ncbi:MAG: hypothetical protein Q4C61_11165 [Lachnospiraceae bacterium]|nr:hypothetical protein [Lachnospiraceae bacterium]
MNRVSTWIEENREKLWFSFLLNALFFTGLLLAFRPVYETNDDVGIASMVNGAKGVYDAHLIYSHYFLGLLLKALYLIKQNFPWYGVLQYVVLYLSFTAVTYVLIRKMASPSAVWISGVLVFWFSYEGYIKVQFTKTAGIASAAGLLLLFYAVTRERISKKALACGMLLSVTGFLYRDAQFFAEAALMTGIGVFLLLDLTELERGKRLQRFGRYIAAFGSLLALVLVLHFADQYFYTSPDWEAYKQSREVKTELYDRGFPSYKENESAYNELGIDENAYRLLRGWVNMDTEKFSVETLEKIASMKTPRRFSRQFAKDFFETFPKGFLKIPCVYCFLLICVYWLCWGVRDRRGILAVIYEALLAGGIYLYMFYQNRYLLNRVDVGIWLAVSMVVLWTFTEGKAYFPNRAGLALLLTVIVAVQPVWKSRYRINAEDAEATMRQCRLELETVSADKEHLYLITTGTVSTSSSYNVLDPIPFGISQNTLPLGGWAVTAPLYLDIARDFGLENPLKDMIGNDRVYVLSRDISSLLEYVRTYYDADAEAEVVRDMGDIKAYRIG